MYLDDSTQTAIALDLPVLSKRAPPSESCDRSTRIISPLGGATCVPVSSDGTRFLVNALAEQGPAESIAVVVNWTAALER